MAVFIGMSYISRIPFRSKTPVGQTALNPLHIFIVKEEFFKLRKLQELTFLAFLYKFWSNFRCLVPPEPFSYLLLVIASILFQKFYVFVRQLKFYLLLCSLESFPPWDGSCFQRHTFSLHWCPEHFQKIKCQHCVNWHSGHDTVAAVKTVFLIGELTLA